MDNVGQYTRMLEENLVASRVPWALRDRLQVPRYARSLQEWCASEEHAILAVVDALIAAQQEFGTVPELATVLQACREDCERRLPDQRPGGVEAPGAAEVAGSRSAPSLPGDDGMLPCVDFDGTVLPPARLRGSDAGADAGGRSRVKGLLCARMQRCRQAAAQLAAVGSAPRPACYASRLQQRRPAVHQLQAGQRSGRRTCT